MNAAVIYALVEERDRIRQMLQTVEAELSNAAGIWSRENGYLVKLTPEQVLREIARVPA